MDQNHKTKKKKRVGNNPGGTTQGKGMLALIVLINILGQGIHAKLPQDSPNIEANQQKEDRAQFHPIQTTQEPLFTTTDQPTLASIRNHNLTITVETFQQNPYLRS